QILRFRSIDTLLISLQYHEFSVLPFRTHRIEPFFQKRDLATFRCKLREIRLLEKLYDGVASSLNFAHGVGKFSFMEQERSFRPCVHHQHVGAKLLKIPNDFLTLRMFIDKAEDLEFSLGIADNTGVVAE